MMKTMTKMLCLGGGIALMFMVYATEAAACKVLVVQSFTEGFYWSQEHKTAIDKAFTGRCELKYFYMDEDLAPDNVKEKGAQAYALYQEWQPDGVIAVNETAQNEFVIPFLKDKVATPVIFSGIYTPATFGYPAQNVTGVEHVAHWEEFVTFVLQLDSSIKAVGMIVPDTPITHLGIPFVEEALKKHSISFPPAFYSNNTDELLAKAAEWEPQIDALFTIPLIGEEATKALVSQFHKPTFTGWRQAVEWGVLCAVSDNGEEVGRLAAEMMGKALDGTPIAELPITHNELGHRMINVNTLKALGLEPSRRLLTGVELIK